MLIIFITILSLLFLLERAFKTRTETKVLKYSNCLYALRDELRERVIQGDINKNDWVFDYLDSSITKTITQLSKISFYTLLIIYLIRNRDPYFNKAQKHLERALKKPGKAPIKNIHDRYVKILDNYILDKHLISLTSLPFSIWLTTKGIYKNLTKQATEYPEFSTLYDYCF